MAQSRSAVKQRGKAEPQQAATVATAVQSDALTVMQLANYHFAQHIGLICVIAGIALLWAGYDKDWMHNSNLCMLSLGLCLLGWFFHELRPFNVSSVLLRVC